MNSYGIVDVNLKFMDLSNGFFGLWVLMSREGWGDSNCLIFVCGTQVGMGALDVHFVYH